MNRQELITRTLMLEQVAAEARARAAKLREELAADARAELAEQGTAPTWRLPDIGTVTLPVSTERVYVADEAALLEWARTRHPGAVETLERIRPSVIAALLETTEPVSDGMVIDPYSGELIPGLGVRPGGLPQALSFRPSRGAQEVARMSAEKFVADIERQLDGPVVLAEVPDA